MSFVIIKENSHKLGFRYKEFLPKEILQFISWEELQTRLSPPREVKLDTFEISINYLIVADYVEIDDVDSFEEVCDLIDSALLKEGLRMATEDELEAALCRNTIFEWGNHFPKDSPYDGAFDGHKKPSSKGLNLNSNTYHIELTRCALKFGDGGEAVCGGYGMFEWLALSPYYRHDPEDMLFEFLESAVFRTVKLAQ